jgi:hypothetical protein
MGRLCTAVFLGTFFVTVPAVAGQNAVGAFDGDTPSAAADVAPTTLASAVVATEALAPTAVARKFAARPSALAPMYLSLAALQGYDIYSTTTALKQGAVEANPLLKGVAGNKTALIAVKSATTAVTIYAAERLWRQNRRKSAIALLVASNALMGAVAMNNAAVLRQR